MATKQQKIDAFKFARGVIAKAAEGGGDVGRLSASLETVYNMTLKIIEDIDQTDKEQPESEQEDSEQA